MDEQNRDNISTWCRVCLSDVKGTRIPLDYEVENLLTVIDLITSCSGIMVFIEDRLPKGCCEKCVESLISAYRLANQCRESDKKLRMTCAKNAKYTTAAEDSDTDAKIVEGDDREIETGDNIIFDAQTRSGNLTTCCACRTDFETEKAFTDHIATVHMPVRSIDSSKKPFQCDICFKRYFKKTSLNRHKKMGAFGSKIQIPKEDQPQKIRCCGCRKDFGNLNELKEHSRFQHTASRMIDDTKPFECKICFKRYSNKTSLSRHFRERFTEKQPRMVRKLAQNQCCGCHQKFATKEQLDQHSKQIHLPDRRVNMDEIKPFECETCFSRYSSREALSRHRVYIHMNQLYKCQLCDKAFVKRIMLRFHEKKFHDGVQQDVIGPYQCSTCGKTFMQSSSLTNHEKVHIQSERFECPICMKTFFSKGNLQTHIRLHDNSSQKRQPKYECPICRCWFKTPNYLETHTRVHTGEKPYQCKYCSKQFAHVTGYKRHLLTHNSLKSFTCRFCNRGFTNRPNMLIHEKGHGTERNAKCDICEKEFVHERYLKKHRKRHLF